MQCRSYIRFQHERDVDFLHRFHEPFCHSITLRATNCRRAGLQIQLSSELPCFMSRISRTVIGQPLDGPDVGWRVLHHHVVARLRQPVDSSPPVVPRDRHFSPSLRNNQRGDSGSSNRPIKINKQGIAALPSIQRQPPSTS